MEENWRPRVDAVAKVLSSWRSRSLSFRGKALVINALALSRIWYIASLVYMLPRILHELCTLVFNFFWSGKKDLVSRTVVLQSPFFGEFLCCGCQIESLVFFGPVGQAFSFLLFPVGFVYVILV